MKLIDVCIQEYHRLRRFVVGMGLVGADAEDVLQDVATKALQHNQNHRSETESLAWLIKTCTNACRWEYRRRSTLRRHSQAAQDQAATGPSTATDNALIQSEQRQIVLTALEDLDEDLRTPMVLRYYCDMNSTQIARVLQQSPSTIRSRLSQARLRLAKDLKKQGVQR